MNKQLKIQQEKVTSLLTKCYVCDEIITKKNAYDGVYLCRSCSQLSSEELFSKMADATRDSLIDDPIFYNKDILKSLIMHDDD